MEFTFLFNKACSADILLAQAPLMVHEEEEDDEDCGDQDEEDEDAEGVFLFTEDSLQ